VTFSRRRVPGFLRNTPPRRPKGPASASWSLQILVEEPLTREARRRRRARPRPPRRAGAGAAATRQAVRGRPATVFSVPVEHDLEAGELLVDVVLGSWRIWRASASASSTIPHCPVPRPGGRSLSAGPCARTGPCRAERVAASRLAAASALMVLEQPRARRSSSGSSSRIASSRVEHLVAVTIADDETRHRLRGVMISMSSSSRSRSAPDRQLVGRLRAPYLRWSWMWSRSQLFNAGTGAVRTRYVTS